MIITGEKYDIGIILNIVIFIRKYITAFNDFEITIISSDNTNGAYANIIKCSDGFVITINSGVFTGMTKIDEEIIKNLLLHELSHINSNGDLIDHNSTVFIKNCEYYNSIFNTCIGEKISNDIRKIIRGI